MVEMARCCVVLFIVLCWENPVLLHNIFVFIVLLKKLQDVGHPKSDAYLFELIRLYDYEIGSYLPL